MIVELRMDIRAMVNLPVPVLYIPTLWSDTGYLRAIRGYRGRGRGQRKTFTRPLTNLSRLNLTLPLDTRQNPL